VSSQKYNEICTIIHDLKSNKTDRADDIPPELIKIGGRTLRQKLYEFIFKKIG